MCGVIFQNKKKSAALLLRSGDLQGGTPPFANTFNGSETSSRASSPPVYRFSPRGKSEQVFSKSQLNAHQFLLCYRCH